MSSREDILARIRTITSSNLSRDQRKAAVAERMRQHPVGIVPKISGSRRTLTRKFKEKVLASDASIEVVKSEKVSKAITNYLRDHNLPAKIRVGEDRRLKKYLKYAGDLLEIDTGPSAGNDLVCVSHALGGVAETGTLFLTSGKNNPTTLNFLPETHIVIVDRKSLVATYEELLIPVDRKSVV